MVLVCSISHTWWKVFVWKCQTDHFKIHISQTHGTQYIQKLSLELYTALAYLLAAYENLIKITQMFLTKLFHGVLTTLATPYRHSRVGSLGTEGHVGGPLLHSLNCLAALSSVAGLHCWIWKEFSVSVLDVGPVFPHSCQFLGGWQTQLLFPLSFFHQDQSSTLTGREVDVPGGWRASSSCGCMVWLSLPIVSPYFVLQVPDFIPSRAPCSTMSVHL